MFLYYQRQPSTIGVIYFILQDPFLKLYSADLLKLRITYIITCISPFNPGEVDADAVTSEQEKI